MVILKYNKSQTLQINKDLKQSNIVFVYFNFSEKNLRNLWQKNIDYKKYNIRHIQYLNI